MSKFLDKLDDNMNDDEIRIIQNPENPENRNLRFSLTDSSSRLHVSEGKALRNLNFSHSVDDFSVISDADSADDEELLIEEKLPKPPSPPVSPESPIDRTPGWGVITMLAVVVAILCALTYYYIVRPQQTPANPELPQEILAQASAPIIAGELDQKASVRVIATTVRGADMLILVPEGAQPELVIGTEALGDSSVIMAVQAADVRADNGEIVGSYVLNGELISRGESKSGYCAIINGELTVGVADMSPMLEKALLTGGSFFRQYPLVVGGQIVENKWQNSALRKALVDLNGKPAVVLSRDRMTFHDFSQALIDMGITTAIYLTGSTAYAHYDTPAGRETLGQLPDTTTKYANFIVWK